jgi:hypothetical protein
VHFLPALAPEELASAYAAAKVHALVSWYDCAPNSALEAAAAGCNIVLTTESGAHDYFHKAAWYCDPGDLKAMRDAVRAALNAPRQPELRASVIAAHTWENAARLTREAYERALSLEPRLADENFHHDLEKATTALAQLLPLVEKSRAALWQEKSELAQTVVGYRNGRVMRLLNWLIRAKPTA